MAAAASLKQIVLVGEGPSATSGSEPFSGRSGAFLESVLDWPRGDLPRRWRCVNVFERWPGRQLKGSRFDVPKARRRVEKLTRASEAWRPVPLIWLLAGHRVGAAFHVPPGHAYLEPIWLPEVMATGFVIPHPSGVNRWWNAARNHERFREFVEDLGTIWLAHVA